MSLRDTKHTKITVSFTDSLSQHLSQYLVQPFIKSFTQSYKESTKKWSWDKETVSKAQGLFAACRLVAFAVLYNGLEPLKLLVTKLQKHNQGIYQAYQIIDQVINDLRETKYNMDNFTTGMKWRVKWSNQLA